MRILFLGDIVGRPGRKTLARHLDKVRADKELDLVFANGENGSGGVGLSKKIARELLGMGVDMMTSGNHIWKFKDIYAELDREPRLLRPANYPAGAPGRGWGVFSFADFPDVAVINLLGRTFMQAADCPFAAADGILEQVPDEVKIRIVDFHAEATSEKQALAHHLDGRVSAVLGTHTHVQTNDARIFPLGTAFMTDLGMCGPENSCLGMDPKAIIHRFRTGLPARFEVARGPVVLQGAIFEIDENTGSARSIEAWAVRE